MNLFPDQGTQSPGNVAGVHFGYSMPWVSPADDADFHMTPGVARDGMLGVKDLMSIRMDVPSQVGFYWIHLTPAATGQNVLLPGIDFNNPVAGSFQVAADEVVRDTVPGDATPQWILFGVAIPEPGTLVLLAFGGVTAIRRRRAGVIRRS